MLKHPTEAPEGKGGCLGSDLRVQFIMTGKAANLMSANRKQKGMNTGVLLSFCLKKSVCECVCVYVCV